MKIKTITKEEVFEFIKKHDPKREIIQMKPFWIKKEVSGEIGQESKENISNKKFEPIKECYKSEFDSYFSGKSKDIGLIEEFNQKFQNQENRLIKDILIKEYFGETKDWQLEEENISLGFRHNNIINLSYKFSSEGVNIFV